MNDVFHELNVHMAALPAAVQVWMNWMTIIFSASLLFVWKHTGARWTVVALLLTLPLAMFIFYIGNTIHLMGIAHILLWVPLLIYFYRNDYKSGALKISSPYGVWIILFVLTTIISLLFDVRDIILVLLGEK